jgi:glutaredoxin
MRIASLIVCATLALPAVFAACDRDPAASDTTEPASAAPVKNELPALELRDDTPDLLLTWVDEQGDFHVVQKVADVPEKARHAVRAVVTTREQGTGKLVYVADLGAKKPDGTYPVRTMTRAEWDDLGAARRKARLEALAPSASAPPPASGAPGSPSPGVPGAPPGASNVVAIIYGAEWCKPCHDAARYLRGRGVKVVDKDIEENAVARQEMRAKLERARMPPTSSIPIIDIAGKIMVGFSPTALDHAIESAEAQQPL